MDITVQKQAETEWLAPNAELGMLLEALPVIAFRRKAGDNFGVVYISGNVQTATGYTSKDFLSRTSLWVENIHPDDAKVLSGWQGPTVEDGVHEIEYRWRIADGSYRWFLERSRLVPLPDGQPGYLVGVWLDISERKQLEETVRIKCRNLEEVDDSLRVLLQQRDKERIALGGNITSNMRTLVLPFVEKLRSSQLTEMQKTYLDILEQNLNEIVPPFLRKTTEQYFKFTLKELEVVNLLRSGKTTEEIAEFLGISKHAIAFHRNSIRKKLGLINKRANLCTHLRSL